jgi:hypothetical protein
MKFLTLLGILPAGPTCKSLLTPFFFLFSPFFLQQELVHDLALSFPGPPPQPRCCPLCRASLLRPPQAELPPCAPRCCPLCCSPEQPRASLLRPLQAKLPPCAPRCCPLCRSPEQPRRGPRRAAPPPVAPPRGAQLRAKHGRPRTATAPAPPQPELAAPS